MNRREALQALVSLPAVARLSVAQLKPEDVIVVECDEHLPLEAIERIKEMTEKVWPCRKVVVFDKGLRMKIVAGSEAVV